MRSDRGEHERSLPKWTALHARSYLRRDHYHHRYYYHYRYYHCPVVSDYHRQE